MKKIAVLLICVFGCGGLLLFVSIEYRIAALAALVVLVIANDTQRRRALEFARNGIVQMIRPPLSLVLWLCDVASDVSPIPRLWPSKGFSRAELKQHWVDSWMTAPARYLRSRAGGK